MKKISELVMNYTNKTGVTVSIVVTVFSITMLIISLLGIKFNNDALESICFISLIIEFLYGIILCFKILKDKTKYLHLIPFLFLNWFIGCFCTNIFVNIFENLPIWVYLITFIFCISNFIIYSNLKHKLGLMFCYFINGLTYLMIIYYMIYLIPFAPISFIGILALGLGFYGLVPMIVFVIHSITLIKILPENRNNLISFASGILVVVLGLTLFTLKLSDESTKMSKNSITKSFEKTNDDLPTYITISQNLKPNFFNEILLKKDIVYVFTDNFFEFRGFDNFGGKQYNERKTHNPFINIAYLFSEDLDLSADDRINILKSNFDKRLETEEQLWSGNDLITKNIKEDVKIFANNRLAYTEITMDVACNEDSWGQKEAIYSFQLPEGSVATSLSLWVNGVERKGVLTTKEKATKAYKQIVGIEARDPSLMQWKEGNKVVVRVFPISKELPRTFKCGFTTPLKVENKEMKYQSLNIKGPNISNAETISRLQMVGNSKFEASKDFELDKKYYINKSTGLDDWEVIMPLNNEVFSNAFVWKDKVYEIKELEKQTVQFTPSEIILDLNSSWTEEEVATLVNQKNKKYFTYFNNQKEEINKENYETVLLQFEDLHYSLLPLYKLPENSLVITKSGSFSANFEELETSNYLNKIKLETKDKRLKIINISDEINPFWQTIKEQKYVEFINCDLKKCLTLVNDNQFLSFKTSENSVNIEQSDISIHENSRTETSTNNGSNHIYRMYAFGKVLDEQVKIQQDSLANNSYVSLAKDANIVTPISSLIVLETDEDYVKNGIEKNVNTLGNASINNDGAVPEPHEWLMIIIGLCLLFFYYKKHKKQLV
ncbi:XrtN system VIT domain-containing protein [Flavobacterium sp.]|uniref:XrtN system VIT domain-containing protein n=1 Tax=Flavobacterium sp. TaxID=239 RepID=UPI003753001F